MEHPSENQNEPLSAADLENLLVLKEVYLETTSLCNLRCIHCMDGQEGYVGQHLPYELFANIMSVLEKYKPLVHLWGNGETFLHPNLMEMFRSCRELGCAVGIQTNGVLLIPRIVDELLERGLAYLHVSMDGATKETFEKVRRGCNFDKLLKNLNYVKKKLTMSANPPSYGFQFVAMRLNIHELPLLVRLGHDLGARFLTASDLCGETPLTSGQTIGSEADSYRTYILEALREAKRLNFSFGLTHAFSHIVKEFLAEDHEGNTAPVHAFGERRETNHSEAVPARDTWVKDCKRPWMSLMIRSNGNVTACCTSWRPLGNLRDSPLEKIWLSREFMMFRLAEISTKPPPECVACTCEGWKKISDGDLSSYIVTNSLARKYLNSPKEYEPIWM